MRAVRGLQSPSRFGGGSLRHHHRATLRTIASSVVGDGPSTVLSGVSRPVRLASSHATCVRSSRVPRGRERRATCLRTPCVAHANNASDLMPIASSSLSIVWSAAGAAGGRGACITLLGACASQLHATSDSSRSRHDDAPPEPRGFHVCRVDIEAAAAEPSSVVGQGFWCRAVRGFWPVAAGGRELSGDVPFGLPRLPSPRRAFCVTFDDASKFQYRA